MSRVEQEIAPTPATIPTIVSKKKQLISSAMKRTSEWIFSQEIPSDITIRVGGASFSLHKFPFISKCGYIRRLISETNEPNLSVIEIPNIPGGIEVFELVAKFCYQINFEITTENVAFLRCAAEYLEMTEDYAAGNLISRTEEYLEEVALVNLSNAVSVLHKSEELIPISDKVKLVSRCIDAVAYMACNGSRSYLSTDTENYQGSESSSLQPKAIVDSWMEELTVLRIETFQRVLMAMKARGFEQYALGPVIMLYAQKILRGLDVFGQQRKKIESREEHEKRIVLETVVGLLPMERNTMSVSFLSMLLRAAIYLETTVACRLDLEKRMALQLDQAVLDDLMIPAYSVEGDSMFDVDTVKRIFTTYLEHEVDGNRFGYTTDDEFVSPPPSDVLQVGKLIESYLSEIASDANLTTSKFASIAELIPEQIRVNEDGMYRAIDIYLKAHPSLAEPERKKLCSLMDYQKLSRGACAHAAQNSRLPVQIVVQVLHYEQQRLRKSTNQSFSGAESPALSIRSTSYGSSYHNAPEEFSRLQRENDDLKMELGKMRMQLNQAQKAPVQAASAEKPPLPKKSIVNSISKKLGKLYPFSRSDSANSKGKARTKPPKNRRHSIS